MATSRSSSKTGTRSRAIPAGYTRDGRVDLRYLPRIVWRSLSRERAYGMAAQRLHGCAGGNSPEGNRMAARPTIFLDTGTLGYQRLETAIHEALHLACPWMFEDVVTPVARYVARIVWKLGYRQPVNG